MAISAPVKAPVKPHQGSMTRQRRNMIAAEMFRYLAVRRLVVVESSVNALGDFKLGIVREYDGFPDHVMRYFDDHGITVGELKEVSAWLTEGSDSVRLRAEDQTTNPRRRVFSSAYFCYAVSISYLINK
jgi:hypothetical protein